MLLSCKSRKTQDRLDNAPEFSAAFKEGRSEGKINTRLTQMKLALEKQLRHADLAGESGFAGDYPPKNGRKKNIKTRKSG
jgi:hypothetical protein